ncbi:hypothetical protein [Paenibacillus illinoisensis]
MRTEVLSRIRVTAHLEKMKDIKGPAVSQQGLLHIVSSKKIAFHLSLIPWNTFCASGRIENL